MKFFHSIRTKLTLWYTAWLGATLLAFGATAYFLTRTTLSENLDLSLRNEVVWVNEFIEPKAMKVRLTRAALGELQQLKAAAMRQVPKRIAEEEAEFDSIWNQIYQHTLLTSRKQHIQILDRNGDLLYRSPKDGMQLANYSDIPYKTIGLVTVRAEDGREFRLAVTQNDHVKIFVGYPLEHIYEALEGLFSTFLYLSPLAILISLIGGWFLAHQSLKPVDAITHTARTISLRNLDQQLPTRKVDDELGRLTITFNDMIARLRSSFAQIQQFSIDASHELRTPLTIMRGEIEVALRNSRLARPIRDLLSSICDELVRLSSIVDSLMLLIKSDAGRFSFHFQKVSLDNLLTDLDGDARVLAAAKGVKINIEKLEPVTITGDAARLRQLFLNLIDNAVKYTPPRGKIFLSIASHNRAVEVIVRDTGIGIPRKDLERIFERFYRVDRPGHKAAAGSGLGLAIAKWIAEAHDGSIRVNSRVRVGSTFTVSFPLPSTKN